MSLSPAQDMRDGGLSKVFQWFRGDDEMNHCEGRPAQEKVLWRKDQEVL